MKFFPEPTRAEVDEFMLDDTANILNQDEDPWVLQKTIGIFGTPLFDTLAVNYLEGGYRD